MLLGFCFWTLFRTTFCDFVRQGFSCDFWKFFIFLSKCGKTVLEYRRDHRDNHSSDESPKMEKKVIASQFLLFPSQYSYKNVDPGTNLIHLSQIAGIRVKGWPYGYPSYPPWLSMFVIDNWVMSGERVLLNMSILRRQKQTMLRKIFKFFSRCTDDLLIFFLEAIIVNCKKASFWISYFAQFLTIS